MRKLLLFIFLPIHLSSFCQTITDGLMMPEKDFCTGFMYGMDRWTRYWEGELQRENDNVGTVTTQSLMWVGNYGIHERVNIIAMLPYVKTEASKGTLHSMEGIQDLTLAVKYNFFKRSFTESAFKTFAVLSYSTPLSDYTPDFFPLSIGTATQNLSYRLTANYKWEKGVFVNTSGAYTWRSNTTLDRPAYYTGGQLYMTDQVKMPNVFDFVVSVGYVRHGLMAEAHYIQQNTLGGDDIRRQDMPFVSNRMNFSRVGILTMYYLPSVRNLALRAGADKTVVGRNVGKALTLTGGLLYTFHFSGTAAQVNQ